MKIAPQTEELLNAVRRKRTEMKTFRETFELRKQAEFEAQTAQLRAEIATLARQAYAAGAPKTQIGKYYGTKDARTITTLLSDPSATLNGTQSLEHQIEATYTAPDSLTVTLRNYQPDPDREAWSGTYEYTYLPEHDLWEAVDGYCAETNAINALIDADTPNPVNKALDSHTRNG